jgi:hypothetical protein
MQLTDDTYVHAIFFLQCDEFNWMAHVYREGDGPWEIEYRFRYFEDDKIEGSADRKSWYSMVSHDNSDETLRQAMKVMRETGSMMAEGLEVPFEELTVEGGSDKVLEVLSQQSWASIRKATPEEIASAGGEK